MKKTFFLSILSICSFFASAQISFNTPDEGGINSFVTMNKDYSDVKATGSPFLEDDLFKPGVVLMKGKKQMDGEFRFNAYKGELEISKSETKYSVVLKRSYISVKIENTLYQLLPYKDIQGRVKVAYFNPQNEGMVQLLFKPEIKLKRGRTPQTGYDRYVPPKYIDASNYYIKVGDKPAVKTSLKRKKILKFLKDHEDKVSGFIKENSLNLRKKEDIVKVLNFYNEL
ncbi:hypothetical protein [Ascidiimonas aurantiaca]|uniref:hypothetical protein n=1 Tax=Ascidiimonas aurantiaca TaxID=1685432 RepID=UPI0030EDE541